MEDGPGTLTLTHVGDPGEALASTAQAVAAILRVNERMKIFLRLLPLSL